MKKYFSLLFLSLLVLGGCQSQAQDHSSHNAAETSQIPKPQKAEKKKILHYIDPMHPWYKSDKPGIAPDCGMDLVPVYAEETSPGSSPVSATSFRLSSEKLQRIGVKTEEAQSRPLIREIQTNGRVAYDPELYLAQQEYLIALKTSGGTNSEIQALQSNLVKSARNRLEILGMSSEQIEALRRSRKAQSTLLLPNKGASTLLYGEVYESDLPFIKTGQHLEIIVPGSSEKIESRVDSISPNLNPNTRTAQIRSSVANPSNNSQPVLRPDMFVKMILHADLGAALSIPDNAIIDTGSRKIIFVEKETGLFEMREIKTGKRGTGYVEVISGLNAGDKVVTQGNFLLDSETSLKGLIQHSGGHQH